MYTVSGLYTYPVKSFSGRQRELMELDDFGPKHDRRFMLVSAEGKHVTQRTEPLMASLLGEFDGKELVLEIAGERLHLPVEGFSLPIDATVWSDRVSVMMYQEAEVHRAISDYLAKDVRLVFMPESTFRSVDPDFSPRRSRVGFADGFPFLLCTEGALEDLNQRLDSPMPTWRFRPNIVISGASAFEESAWKTVQIGDVVFDLVKPCARCSMTTLDETGSFNKEPLKTLATYRRNEFGVCFGENMAHNGAGVIRVGDALSVIA